MTHVEILAEPGSTAIGRRDLMLDLIDIAQAAGCDAVKWQWLSSAARLCQRRHAEPKYLDAYKLIEGTLADLDWLCRETRLRGLRAIVTCYLPEDAAVIGVCADAVKIASFEAGDGLLLRMAAQTGKPLYISTGMMHQGEVNALLARVQPDVLLHCASAYPAPLGALNLRVLTQWDRVFRHHRIGFSDHSRDSRVGAWAVAAGAEVLEVHCRHPETPEDNADYATAHDPLSLKVYVEAVRHAEIALGDGVKAPRPEEDAMQPYRVQP